MSVRITVTKQYDLDDEEFDKTVLDGTGLSEGNLVGTFVEADQDEYTGPGDA